MSKNYFLLLVVVCFLLTLLYIDSMWSLSVDLAHHYALAYRIGEQWVLSATNDPTLGEMNIYPRGSHIIAAVVGSVFNSTFVGIQITTLLSLAFLWLGVLLIMHSLQRQLATISVLLFTVLIFLNAVTAKFDVHGHEIVGNFFFSQLVGHSILFFSIFLSINTEKKYGSGCAIVLLIALMAINSWVHLLPAVEMLGIIFGLIFFYVMFDFLIYKKIKITSIKMLFIGVIAILILFFHPSFSAMKALSQNNGGLTLNNIAYPFGLIGLCVLVFLASLVLALKWFHNFNKDENVALKYIAIYGGVTAILCILQLLLASFGHGSDYAVKKYGFGLVTIFIIEISLLFGLYIAPLIGQRAFFLKERGELFRVLMLAVLLFIIFSFSVPSRKLVDVSDVVSMEKKLVAIVDTLVPTPDFGKNNVIVGLEDMPNTINYMFSMSIAKTSRSVLQDVLASNKISNLENFSYVISSKNNKLFGSDYCDSLIQGSISVIRSQCLEFNSTNFEFEQKLILKDLVFSTFGDAHFENDRNRIQSSKYTDAGLVSGDILLPPGLYKIEAVMSWDVDAEQYSTNAAHLSLHGVGILIPINNSQNVNKYVSTTFVTDGKPFRLSFGLGGWSKGKGFVELNDLKISRVKRKN